MEKGGRGWGGNDREETESYEGRGLKSNAKGGKKAGKEKQVKKRGGKWGTIVLSDISLFI